ncbi:MAG: hypothetical protein WBG96_14635 [Thermoanaerobaculia bacterium]
MRADAGVHLDGLDIDAELLSPDADFERIARHTPLRLWGEVSE